MNKDVIYIDVEDDITAIIGKVKSGTEKIVALVPPKRIGVLQSAVNLRLLQRTAQQNNKHLVLISNNQALSALAAAAKIPVARNLQSKPEIPAIAALSIDDDDDIIDGAQLPIGELARTADTETGMGPVDIGSQAVEATIRSSAAAGATSHAAPPAAGQAPAKAHVKKSGAKVPNFNKFRKKFMIIVSAVVLLIAFLVWAIAFAPRATVVITARTTDSSMNAKVSLDTAGETSLANTTLHAATETVKKDVSLPITATGTKDVGEKATGKVKFSTSTISNLGRVIPAGTEIESASGLVYLTDTAATIALTGSTGTATAPVTAASNGATYNGATGAASGAPSGISVSFSVTTSGGTDKTITIVTQSDVDKAAVTLKEQDTASIKKQLTKQFTGGVVAIDQSFKVDTTGVTPTPAVDEEATDGKAVLSGSVSYSLVGVSKNEIDQYLNDYYAQQLKGVDNQRLYENGAKNVTFTSVAESTGGYTATMVATAKIGPKVNEGDIKEASKGKNYGDIQSSIEAIQGIDNVDIKFWPFWVSHAPNDAKKITVEFNLNGK